MNYHDFTELIKSTVLRNQIILADTTRKAERNKVNLHWSSRHAKTQNVGDYLSQDVVDYAKAINGITDHPVSKTRHLYAIGSIIDLGFQDATIWGSGLLRGKSDYRWKKFRKLDIRSVRGPETRRVLIDNGYDCPEAYGDPGVLASLIYNPENIDKKFEYKIIRHYSSVYPCENGLSPLILGDWRPFIDELLEAKLIISSSLHGIILAESYGIPAILLNPGEANLFKYRDYYYSTERYKFPIVNSVEEALNTLPAPLPDVKSMQTAILSYFPCDLWEEN